MLNSIYLDNIIVKVKFTSTGLKRIEENGWSNKEEIIETQFHILFSMLGGHWTTECLIEWIEFPDGNKYGYDYKKYAYRR